MQLKCKKEVKEEEEEKLQKKTEKKNINRKNALRTWTMKNCSASKAKVQQKRRFILAYPSHFINTYKRTNTHKHTQMIFCSSCNEMSASVHTYIGINISPSQPLPHQLCTNLPTVDCRLPTLYSTWLLGIVFLGGLHSSSSSSSASWNWSTSSRYWVKWNNIFLYTQFFLLCFDFFSIFCFVFSFWSFFL